MNGNTLLTRAQRGEKLTVRELDYVRTALRDGRLGEDKYTLIHVLWKASDARSSDLIWPHASHPDEMVRRIALQALAELNPSDEVFHLAIRMSQDHSALVRMASATAVGTLGALLPRRAPEAARFLLEHFEGQPRIGAEWESYYEGLLNLAQVPQHQRPLATRALDTADIQSDVISKARSLAAHS